MGLFDKIRKGSAKPEDTPNQPEATVVDEIIDGDKRTIVFDDGFELETKIVESKKVTFNLDAKKAESFSSNRIDLEGGILAEGESGFSYIRDGVKLFEITKRMKAYKDLIEWSGCSVRRLIAEKQEGDYGTFYKVWMYFNEKPEK